MKRKVGRPKFTGKPLTIDTTKVYEEMTKIVNKIIDSADLDTIEQINFMIGRVKRIKCKTDKVKQRIKKMLLETLWGM